MIAQRVKERVPVGGRKLWFLRVMRREGRGVEFDLIWPGMLRGRTRTKDQRSVYFLTSGNVFSERELISQSSYLSKFTCSTLSWLSLSLEEERMGRREARKCSVVQFLSLGGRGRRGS